MINIILHLGCANIISVFYNIGYLFGIVLCFTLLHQQVLCFSLFISLHGVQQLQIHTFINYITAICMMLHVMYCVINLLLPLLMSASVFMCILGTSTKQRQKITTFSTLTLRR